MLQIIPDTNFLIYAAKYKLDLEAELNKIISEKYEIIILDIVREEILRHARAKGMKKHDAELILKILIHLERKGIAKEQATPGAKNADQALLKLDSSNNIIATMDRNLKRKFRHAGIISLRQKKYLAFI